MARPQSRFICQRCAESFLRWEGQCRACGEWNSLVETIVREPSRTERAAALGDAAAPMSLGAISEADLPRYSLGIGELDRVLGGGLVPGSLVLLGGEPGIGKSTLLLQAAAGLARDAVRQGTVLYASGEESPGQIRLRGDPARACSTVRPVTVSRSLPNTMSGGSSRSPARRGPSSSSSIRSRRPRSRSSTAPPAASARSANPPCA